MTQTDEYFLESKPLFSGKIREVYNFSDDKILIKTSDKISAYDFVFEDELPNKGALLTQISKYWFEKTRHIIDNHTLNDDELKKLIPVRSGESDLFQAMKQIAETGQGPKEQIPSAGCGIKWKHD